MSSIRVKPWLLFSQQRRKVAQLLAAEDKLCRHGRGMQKNRPALFDSGDADGFLFYVMPYVEGQTLQERIDREKQ
jgi:hypothetical protein